MEPLAKRLRRYRKAELRGKNPKPVRKNRPKPPKPIEPPHHSWRFRDPDFTLSFAA